MGQEELGPQGAAFEADRNRFVNVNVAKVQRPDGGLEQTCDAGVTTALVFPPSLN
jgi:hypothetical protein